MHRIILALIFCTSGTAAFSDDFKAGLGDFTDEVSQNPFTENATWLEMLNVFGDWEKVMLVFGYANNFSACESVRQFASSENPSRSYRCNPVN